VVSGGFSAARERVKLALAAMGSGDPDPYSIAFASGDLAYTVGFERGEVAIDDGSKKPMIIRVTHVYRRFDDEWRLVHRHADFPPDDQREAQ
jgi:ketosteroid isomerase-like protein